MLKLSPVLRFIVAIVLAAAAASAWAAGKNTPPTVNLTSPTNGSTFVQGAPITLSANASDSGGSVTRVEFYRGATLIASVAAAPYTYTWANAPIGTHSITAKATDNGGATATSTAASITVAQVPPSVSITSPVAGSAVGTSVDVAGTFSGASDTTILVFNGNSSTVVGTASAGAFVAQGVRLAPGSNTITVTAVRRDGTPASTASISVHVPHLLAVLTSPAKNTTYDRPPSLTLQASVLTATGTVRQVDYFNGGTLLGSATAAPYSFVWNNPPLGNYDLVARVTNDAGFTADSTPIPVSIAGPNTLPTVSLTSPASGSTYLRPASITLAATATDSDGSIARVDFLQNGAVIGSTNVAPYRFTWSGMGVGDYALTARAVDNRNGEMVSSPVNVSVRDPAPVMLTSPTISSNLQTYSPITLSAAVSGQAYGVRFYTQTGGVNTLIGESPSTSSPYTYTWTSRVAGTYTFVASALMPVQGLPQPMEVWSDPVTVNVASNPNGEVVYLHHDIAGSVIGATDAGGNLVWTEDYRPYGERIVKEAASAGNRQFYAGKALDADTGLSYMGARYYDPAVGRFMAIDPLGLKEQDQTSFNRYAYARNNPYRFIDPDGREPVEIRSPEWMRAFVPGQVMWDNARTAIANSEFTGAGVAVIGMVAEIGATVATGGMARPVGVVAGQGGRFASLAGQVGDDLTAHHIPQAALKFTTRSEGGAVVMTTAEHEATRTFGSKGARTAIQDAGKSFRDVLAADIRDVRSIVGKKYNEGLRDVLQYYRDNFPALMEK